MEPDPPASPRLALIRSLMEANGHADKQVWITEYGARPGPPSEP
jgi:hypothetical protein